MIEFLSKLAGWLLLPAIVSFVACFVLAAFSHWRAAKPAIATLIFICTLIMGAFIFTVGCGVTLEYLGGFWTILLLFFFGIGPALVATAILLWHAQWLHATVMIACGASIVGWRVFCSNLDSDP